MPTAALEAPMHAGRRRCCLLPPPGGHSIRMCPERRCMRAQLTSLGITVRVAEKLAVKCITQHLLL